MRNLALCVMVLAAGCGDDPKRPLGAVCATDTQCESGLCGGGICLDPDRDEDLDGIINRIEAALDTNPLVADSDSDGDADPVEIGDVSAPTDTDGDGRIDAIESVISDVDSDCIPDERDANDRFSDLPSTQFPDACGTGKPFPGDKPGGGAEACDSLVTRLRGTCAEPFGNAFGDCFDAAGCMTPESLPDGTSRLRWENGAHVDQSPTSERISMFASNGVLCAEASTPDTGDQSTRIDYEILGRTFILEVDEEAATYDITCPGGEHLRMTATDGAAIGACQGGAYEFCDGVVPGICASPGDCDAPQVCCDLGGGTSYCLAPESCPQ